MEILRLLLDDLVKTLRGNFHPETMLLAKVLAENIVRYDETLATAEEKKIIAAPVRVDPFGLPNPR